MAAPIVAQSQKHANLNKLVSKENAAKVAHKHLLCSEPNEWPRPGKTVEEKILTTLSEKLKSFPNIFKSTKPSSHEKHDKANARNQLEIGTSSVFRALEHDTLAGVLVSGQATPAIAVNHVISLSRERGCPLLCLDQLAPTVAKATDSKCQPLAFGFKKLGASEKSDFSDIIAILKEKSPIRPMQTIPKDSNDTIVEKVPVIETVFSKLHKFRPIVVKGDPAKVILEEMKRVFSEGLVMTVTKKEDKKKKKKKNKKKNLKDVFDKSYHSQFEVGKRTVTDILERGKLQVILVSEEIVPILMSEPLPSSMLFIAREKKCPVLVLPGMLDTMKSLCGGCVSVLAFKKLSTLHPDTKKAFQQVIEMCLEASATCERINMSQTKDTAVGLASSDLKTWTTHEPEGVQSKDLNQKKMSEQQSSDEEDYSHLYVMKDECKELAELRLSQNAETEKTKKEQTFSSDFISLSGSSQPSSMSEVQKKNKKAPKISKVEKSKPETDSAGSMHESVSNASLSGSSPISTGNNPRTVNADGSKSGGDFIAFSISKTSDVKKADRDDSAVDTSVTMTDKLTSNQNTDNISGSLFTISRAGDAVKTSGEKVTDIRSTPPSKISAQEMEQTQGKSNLKSEKALGMEYLQNSGKSKTKGLDYLALAESATKAGGRRAVKRKAKNEEGFISFAYTETNIKTMTSNPSKKRKKKKNKK